MYNTHTNKKIEFQVVVDNKICIAFNTNKKRKDFIIKLKGTRDITSISNVEYPWNLEEGIHNLVTPSTFAKHWEIEDINRVSRAIKNSRIKTELIDGEKLIVEKYGNYFINGCVYSK